MSSVTRALWFLALFAALLVSSASGAASAEEEKTVSTPEDSALAKIDAYIAEKKIDKERNRWKEQLPPPLVVSFDAKKNYYWNLATSKGDIVIEFMPDVAPKHVSSTIYLTRLGFYDGLIFHRIIPRFMAQGGDPTGTGAGGPGYTYDGEFSDRVKHDRPGLLSMANRGPGTDSSQFFLTFVKTPHLDGKHTIFGKIVEGMDTLRDIEAVGTRSGKPKERVVIEKATISVEAAD
jgi:peptidyl-prolyl cis-trans isomerase B (cyclophilin B)